MKFQPDRLDGVNVISSHAHGQVAVNGQPWTVSALVPWQGDVVAWEGARPGALTAEHFAAVLALRPEVVIFGSGTRLKFPEPSLMRPLIDARVGFETMDTVAACRTYNVLASEGRRVVAALLIG